MNVRSKLFGAALLLSSAALSLGTVATCAQSAAPPTAAPAQSKPVLEPKAIELLKASCARLAAAHSMNAYGGTATHYQGVGTVGTTSSGQTAYASDHYYGGTYGAAYHPPVVVNSYSTGCYNCGGWAAAGAVAAGLVVGATVATANANAAVAAANANAAAAYANYSMGEIVPAIPAGCATPVVNGVTYYLCGNTWFSAAYGAHGVYYRVVTTP